MFLLILGCVGFNLTWCSHPVVITPSPDLPRTRHQGGKCGSLEKSVFGLLVSKPCVMESRCFSGKDVQKMCYSGDKVRHSTLGTGFSGISHPLIGSQLYCMPATCSVAQSYLTLSDPMDCSPPGSSVHGIFQARILEWVAISYSSGSYQSRDQTCISCIDTLRLSHLGSLRALLMPILEVISILEIINTRRVLRGSLGCAYRLQAATYLRV